MANPFMVTPATSFAMGGLGDLAKAAGGRFAQERQEDQQAVKAKEFLAAMGRVNAAQDPKVKQQLLTEVFVNYPQQAQQLRQQTALQMEQAQLEQVGKPETEKVGAQEILEDGTVIQSTSAGVKVFDPTGKLVKGQVAADAIKAARAEKVSNLRKAAGEKKAATLQAEKELKGEVEAGIISQKEAAKASIAAFDRLEKINDTIGIYDEAIGLIDEGAGTGAVESMFPSMKAASIKLDNLQSRLGLDVISNTTFGALSEGEMRLAMETAMPKRLDGPALREWLIQKRDAQEKLSDYLESAAIYLGTPGNTKSGWFKKKKMERAARAEQSPQGAAIDAQSNVVNWGDM